MDLSYDEVRRIYRLEKNTSKLVELPEDFYSQLDAFLKEEKQRYLNSLKEFSIDDARDFSNMKKMVEEVFVLRERKILNLALLASRGNEDNKIVLALPEQKMFNQVVVLLQKQREWLDDMFRPSASRKGASESNARVADAVKVKVLKDVPAFIGTDMKEYGPFVPQQTVELPFAIAKLFSERKLGERLAD